MSTQSYSYQDILQASERARWNIEDIIGGDKRLNFSLPFMPESLARVDGMTELTAEEKLVLNQIRGNTYLCIFGLVEEFILPFVLDHVRDHLPADDLQTRAFLGFAGEEAKHIDLFRRFRREFDSGFGSKCEVIGPPEAIAAKILSFQPLAVAITILHIEWMTQKHFIDGVRDAELDPQFKSLLRHHWMEEAQHAKLDTLLVEALASGMTPEEIDAAVDDYLAIGMFLDGGLEAQTKLDLDSFERATGRLLTAAEREDFTTVQRQANRWTYLGSGMTHPTFLGTLGRLSKAAREKVESVAPIFG